MDFPFGETVTIRRAAAAVDANGDPVRASWTDLATYDRCAVWLTASTEDNVARTAVSSTLEVVLPAGADVTAYDRVVWHGDTYEVLGGPFAWRSPFTGWEPGVQITVARVTG